MSLTFEHASPPTRDPLTTKEGWQRFVEHAPTAPHLVGWQAWRRLDDQARAVDIQARLDYHARLVVVATPTIRQVAHAGRRLVLLNRHQISARRGLIVTGPPATGKTTAITQLGKNYELLVRRQAPHGPRLPVVYVTVPPAATPKMLAVEFARFLGLPIGPRTNQADITNAVCHVLCELCTDLVIVDELHNLSLATRNGAETSDQLKYFSERIPATFIYAGVDVERAGLFAGTRGSQLAGRFATIPAAPFPYGTAAQRADWQALVATLEQALRLHRHPAGALLRLDRYLHQRTGGLIGSLSHLIRGAAITAILDGSERITKATLASVTLDHAAEQAHSRSQTHPSRPRRTPGPATPGTTPAR